MAGRGLSMAPLTTDLPSSEAPLAQVDSAAFLRLDRCESAHRSEGKPGCSDCSWSPRRAPCSRLQPSRSGARRLRQRRCSAIRSGARRCSRVRRRSTLPGAGEPCGVQCRAMADEPGGTVWARVATAGPDEGALARACDRVGPAGELVVLAARAHRAVALGHGAPDQRLGLTMRTLPCVRVAPSAPPGCLTPRQRWPKWRGWGILHRSFRGYRQRTRRSPRLRYPVLACPRAPRASRSEPWSAVARTGGTTRECFRDCVVPGSGWT